MQDKVEEEEGNRVEEALLGSTAAANDHHETMGELPEAAAGNGNLLNRSPSVSTDEVSGGPIV